MEKQGTILVGTIGQGVMMSADGGESWTRAGVRQGMHSDCIVKALLSTRGIPESCMPGPTWGSTRATIAAPDGTCSTRR
jgi:hypothetical protein